MKVLLFISVCNSFECDISCERVNFFDNSGLCIVTLVSVNKRAKRGRRNECTAANDESLRPVRVPSRFEWLAGENFRGVLASIFVLIRGMRETRRRLKKVGRGPSEQ